MEPVTPRELAAAIREVLTLSAHERQRRFSQLVEEEGQTDGE